MATIVDKPTIGIEILQLQVRGLTLLFHFSGLKVQFRYPELMNSPGRTFWGLFCDLGRRYWVENYDLSQEIT